jgi:anti-anti-sigma regulatory factor
MRRIRVDCDCRAISHPDAATIDRLARLQLAVQREGSELQLVGAQPCLLELIDFCGLAEVLRLEAGRQAEEREELGRVEEERDLPDPAV